MREYKPFAAEEHDITGYVAADFRESDNFQSLAKHFPGFNSDRFQPVALRMYMESSKPVFTLYAFDTEKSDTAVPAGKRAVKKFKHNLTFETFISLLRSFDFTLVTRGFDLEEMWVENT